MFLHDEGDDGDDEDINVYHEDPPADFGPMVEEEEEGKDSKYIRSTQNIFSICKFKFFLKKYSSLIGIFNPRNELGIGNLLHS